MLEPLPSDLEIFTTADQSPTLAFKRPDGYVEKMHHSGGALSESLYIYHQTLKDAMDRGQPARVLSFGLGLGYNELLAIGECVSRGDRDWKVWSFEAHASLRSEFARWLREDMAVSQLGKIYDDLVMRISTSLGIAVGDLKNETRAGLADGRLELRGPFPGEVDGVRDCTVVFYDAFSNKMDTDPWLETTLEQRLGPCLAADCAFTTYAATGSLNRGLKALGFRVQKRPGFLGKRESTLALRP